MERRAVLASLGTFVALSGCVSDESEGNPEGELTTTEDELTTTTNGEPISTTEGDLSTTTEGDPSTTTDDCGWPQFCEGSTMVEVIVSSGFSGDVVLETGCRDEDFDLKPGDTKTIERQVDAETCDVTLYIDGRKEYDATIHDYVSSTLRVDSSGEVDEERKEL